MAKKEIDANAEAEVMDADHAEMRVYELGFHLDPDLSVDEAKKAFGKVRDAITAVGSVVAEGEPQKIQLAYTVSRMEQSVRQDFTASHFAWIAYETDGKGHEAVIEGAGADKNIFRFLDVRTSKDAAKHSAEMYEIMRKNAEKPADAGDEEVSDTELDAALKEVGV